MARVTRSAVISGVSAGLFPETAAGNRAGLESGQRTLFNNWKKYISSVGKRDSSAVTLLEYLGMD